MNTNNYSHKRTQRSIANSLILGAMILGASAVSYSQENTLPDSGNVGIGTTDPSAKLQVSGSAIIDSSLTVNDSLNANAVSTSRLSVADDAKVEDDLKVGGNLILPSLTFPETYPETLTFLFADDEAIVRKGSFGDASEVLKSLLYAVPVGFETCPDHYANPTWQNGVDKIFENCPNVRVGIGTDAPDYNLDVRGNSKFGLHSWFGTTASVGADYNNFARFYVKNPSSSAALQVDNSGNTSQYSKLIYMTFTEPTTELINVRNTTLNYSPFTLNANGTLNVANNQGYTTFHLDEAGGLTLYNGAHPTFRIDQGGKLSLYHNGEKTFQVETNGFIRGRRLRLDTETWADYVFEPGYNLMPLNQVEDFVEKEKHLPNVPSQEDLLQNGADVMEMNQILMEKIEELTLYLIEQNKHLQLLQQEVEALKAENVEYNKQ